MNQSYWLYTKNKINPIISVSNSNMQVRLVLLDSLHTIWNMFGFLLVRTLLDKVNKVEVKYLNILLEKGSTYNVCEIA